MKDDLLFSKRTVFKNKGDNRMTTTPKSNGFGSFQFHLVFTVNNEHSQKLIDDGWEVLEKTKAGTVFKFYFTSRKRGDDETALWDLGYALPKGVPDNSWRICWKKSEF